MKDKALFLLLVLAFLTRFFYFNSPTEVVFDEVHFGKFVRAYFTHENYFDIHPPLGKLLIAGVAKLGGFTVGTSDFNTIGQDYDKNNLFVLRILPAIIGALFVGLIYLLALALTESRVAALVAGTMVLFENALITQSRIALLDILLLFFGFLALYLYLRVRDTKSYRNHMGLLALTGVSLGISYSIKWTGLAMALVIGAVALYDLARGKNWKSFFKKLAIIYLVSFAIYVLGFAIHFALLTKPGPGDAYLSQNFKSKSFIERFIEINKAMLSYNAGITTQHPYQSSWYEWPFDHKAIFYWQENKTDAKKAELAARLGELKQELTTNPQNIFAIDSEIADIQTQVDHWNDKNQIWLLGNPVVWFLGIAGILLGIILVCMRLFAKKPEGFRTEIVALLILGWAVNFFPFAPIARPLFLYHYFFPLIFSILLFAYLASYLFKIFLHQKDRTTIAVSALLILVAIGFFVVAPLTYGLGFSANGTFQHIINYLL